MDTICRSCVDCHVTSCDHMQQQYPTFCPTKHGDKSTLDMALRRYREPVNRLVAQVSAQVEEQFYGTLTRIEEAAEFAKGMGAKKIGIATCVGLIRESAIIAKFFRHRGFEVCSLACKAGAVPKETLGIQPSNNALSPNMCNPIYQAECLNEANTDLNFIVGLCVGHDALFTKYSKALCSTLITKDRVLGHNPAAVLYLSHSYYARLFD